MKFIVKFFPEITIKSKPVRLRLAKLLRQNIKTILNRVTPENAVTGHWDKVEVVIKDKTPGVAERCAEALQRIPGIANILQVQDYEIEDINDNFDRMLELTRQAVAEEIAGKSFVVRVKRAGSHEFTSHELEIYIGGGLLQQTDAANVDLRNPDVTVKLEVRNNTLYIIEKRYEGLGGYPMGSQEPVLSLISGGFDSTVSSYLTMKRGIKTHFCFFNLGGVAHEVGVKQVSLYLWEKYGISHRVNFITVPFEDVVAEILQSVNHSHMGVILKRMMLRAASAIAKEQEIEALVTGESVAQVSSQTLTNLSIIDEVTDTLVLRPLITMDKLDIIRISSQIGTEDFAKNMPEYCGVISDRPTTKAVRARVEEEEAKFDQAVLDQAIADRKIIKIDKVMETSKTIAEVEVVATPLVDDVIVDIRHPNEQEKAPVDLTNNDVTTLPFYELMNSLDSFKSDHRYLLYCDKGTMSQLHASHLKAMGYDNILVYLPQNY